MKIKKIYWKTVLELIKKGEKIENIEVDFNNEKIIWKDAMIMGKNGIEIPQDLIDYEEENIDYSEITTIVDDDMESRKKKCTIDVELVLEKEIADWIKKENINVSEFAAILIKNFYEVMKSLPKNVEL